MGCKQKAVTALTLLKMSFADPRSIRHVQDRDPTNTLVLLAYLDKHTSDAGVKSTIRSMRGELKSHQQNVFGMVKRLRTRPLKI